MNNAVLNMLSRYNASTSEEYKNALKEIIQEIVLLGLSRAKFFEHAAFYGGTALRVFYNLDRFSEDIDFSLLQPNPSFNIIPYCKIVQDELTSYGFTVSVEKKSKSIDRKVESAFIKATTLQHLIQIKGIKNPISGTHSNEVLKVKFEVDIDPPEGATFDVKFSNHPIPFSVKLYDLPSMFAGKIHAFLFRNYRGSRVKGRDVYDFIWLSLQKLPLNLRHLEMRMRQTGNWQDEKALTPGILRDFVKQRAYSLNFEAAKNDVVNFLNQPEAVHAWSADLIMHAFDTINVTGKT